MISCTAHHHPLLHPHLLHLSPLFTHAQIQACQILACLLVPEHARQAPDLGTWPLLLPLPTYPLTDVIFSGSCWESLLITPFKINHIPSLSTPQTSFLPYFSTCYSNMLYILGICLFCLFASCTRMMALGGWGYSPVLLDAVTRVPRTWAHGKLSINNSQTKSNKAEGEKGISAERMECTKA